MILKLSLIRCCISNNDLTKSVSRNKKLELDISNFQAQAFDRSNSFKNTNKGKIPFWSIFIDIECVSDVSSGFARNVGNNDQSEIRLGQDPQNLEIDF